MDKLLKPDRFDVEPESDGAEEQWLHWYQTFTNFLEECDSNATNEKKPTLKVCGLTAAKVGRYSEEDSKFIKEETERLLKEGIIEPSTSPWRAQVLVVKGETKKKRMCIDYSQTINRFTQLDAYPLPRVEDVVNKVSKFSVFSTIDLKSAYHQIQIENEERIYAAFEACGRLYQFCRIPFGVTNGVSCFQREIDSIIQKEGLECTVAYLDDVTVGGRNKDEHDTNLNKFLDVAKKYNLTLNMEKCSFAQDKIHLLGYVITKNEIRPDPDRLQPLLKLPPPHDGQSLRRTMGMFAHYSDFIKSFSEKIQPLSSTKSFPLSEEAINSFNELKNEIVTATKAPIQNDIPFTVETDASEFAIGSTLSQAGRPVAFYSKTLSKSEKNHSSVEKEAQAIVESVKKWRHYLIGRPFLLITDQRSVSFMFDNKRFGKIKNEKIQRWRLELSCFKYDIVYRPGKENGVADTMSRLCGTICGRPNLNDIHTSLCHPGVTRFYHWIRSKNLPFSLEEVRRTTAQCRICAELKPRFCKYEGTLIKATAPFERLNLDFKGPIPSATQNKYILTVVDEYSRYPFAFPCRDMTSSTVIEKLKEMFTIFGMPSFIHSDRGTSLMSDELKSFLQTHGVASSHSSAYNPRGNGQVERFNGTIWKTVMLALRTQDLPVKYWESVLPEALHSIRSLLCTSTNTTPHELMFKHPRRSYYGGSVPSWLSQPGPVLLRKHNRPSKYDSLVEEVELIQANPGYAHVKLPNGQEKTVSIRDLAPAPGQSSLETDYQLPETCGNEQVIQEPEVSFDQEQVENDSSGTLSDTNVPVEHANSSCKDSSSVPSKTHPQRIRQRPYYLKDYVSF
ncbi:uncharacterized protein LOC128995632 [Macrosteles quadrilineatus]|uniref:uncharacterized protein LOC128995632 n=1 Tax=Macrosteles quadrilineatus TaxID=74068 RepID=UPI0023E2AFC7|nr:uncharacterized protein LOC128995632 [Macrosteles quadrilineatus]